MTPWSVARISQRFGLDMERVLARSEYSSTHARTLRSYDITTPCARDTNMHHMKTQQKEVMAQFLRFEHYDTTFTRHHY